jgi:hypothetical protein
LLKLIGNFLGQLERDSIKLALREIAIITPSLELQFLAKCFRSRGYPPLATSSCLYPICSPYHLRILSLPFIRLRISGLHRSVFRIQLYPFHMRASRNPARNFLLLGNHLRQRWKLIISDQNYTLATNPSLLNPSSALNPSKRISDCQSTSALNVKRFRRVVTISST